VPLLSSAANGGRNKSTYNMTNYLQQINVETPTNAADGSVDCIIYQSGVTAWVEAQSFNSRHTSLESDKRRTVWGSLEPVRCGLNETFINAPIECKLKPDSSACLNWSQATIPEIEELLGIRSGSLIAVEENDENGVSTKAIFNLSDSVVRTAFNSFMLQLTMLILAIASLGYLRYDASKYVIAPLRKILKIVLRYAENPLAGTPTNDDSTPVSELHIDDLNSDGLDIVDGNGKNSKLGSYETEQLITAVTKITNLLRKCWGVAGAGIQLASIPGISAFADRALLGLLKSFAGINREESIKAWENDYHLGAIVKAFSVEMSFGMDAGWAVEGAVGSSYKIDATYLSPNVNMASRMMCASKQFKLGILVSHAVYEVLTPQAQKVMRHIDTVFVKGSKKKQQIYTFDARHKGVDFFLNKRSNINADKEADNYTPNVWERDQDLREMRSHVNKDFEKKYAAGLEQ